MSTRSWLKSHRKQLITHFTIIVAFVLLTILVVEPLFDRLETVEGESKLHQISLPAETNNIVYHLDHIGASTGTHVDMDGWAFIQGQDSLNYEIYIVLKSADRTYVFDTQERIRTGVTQAYGGENLNLDHSGLSALIPVRELASGNYSVGIYIRKGDIEALQYTVRVINL